MNSKLKASFLKQTGVCTDFFLLFNHLDRISFFVKNSDFQIIAANRNFYSRLGFDEEDQIIGKDDNQLFPKPLASKFRKDDESVLKTGREMPRMVELFLNRHGLPDWFMTHKLPVHNRSGKTVGVMGTVERYNQKQGLKSSDPAIAQAVQLMLSHPGRIDSVADLSKQLGMSHRHFDRRFKEETGLTPQQFLGRARTQLACDELRSGNKELSELALELGYCDQSAFTAQFRTRMGLTPLKYRKQFGE